MSELIDEVDVSEFLDAEGLSVFLDNLKNLFIQRYEPAITDLNDATETGVYRYGNRASNIPVTAGGSMLVMRTSGTYQYQLAFPNNNDGLPIFYTRIHYSGGWSEWKRVTLV